MLTLLGEPYGRRYVAPLVSAAGLLFLAVIFGTLVLPFVIAYASRGFWLKENSFLEQPSIRYQRNVVAFFEGSYSNGTLFYLTWSTDPSYNRMFGTNARIPQLKVRELDNNNDGIYDQLSYRMTLPLQSGEAIKSVRLAFFFRYELKSVVRLVMQTAAYLQQSTQLPAYKLIANGDLELRQRGPIPALAGGIRGAYDKQIFNVSALSYESMWSWLTEYEARNETTIFSCPFPIWYSSPGLRESFEVEGLIRYAVQRVYYQPDLPEILKYGWIQYMCTLVPVAGVLFGLLGFAVKSRIVVTHIELDRVPKGAVSGSSGYKPYHF